MGHRMILLGAGSAIGRPLVELLKKQDVDFTVASRSLKHLPEGVKGLQLDYDNATMMELALKEKEILFLKLPIGAQFLERTLNTLKAARLNGVRFVLGVSVLGASPHSPYMYQRVYGEWEQLLAESKLRYCFLRPNILMQSFVEWYRNELEAGTVFLPEGEGRVSFIDARDVAEMAAKVLMHPMIYHRQVLEITGQRAFSNAETMSFLSFHAERRINYVPVTEDAALKSDHLRGVSDWEKEFILSRHQAVKSGQLSWISGHFEKIMGKPQRRFEDFCAELGEKLKTSPTPKERINLGGPPTS